MKNAFISFMQKWCEDGMNDEANKFYGKKRIAHKRHAMHINILFSCSGSCLRICHAVIRPAVVQIKIGLIGYCKFKKKILSWNWMRVLIFLLRWTLIWHVQTVGRNLRILWLWKFRCKKLHVWLLFHLHCIHC